MNIFMNNMNAIIDIKTALKHLEEKNKNSGQLPSQLPSIDEQQALVAQSEALEQIKNALAQLEKGSLPDSHKEIGKGYVPPNQDELRATFKGFSGRQIANLLDVNPRTVRKWIGGESTVSYSAWRLFLIKTGRVTESLIHPV